MTLPLPTTDKYTNYQAPAADQDFLNQLDWLINNFYGAVTTLIETTPPGGAAFTCGTGAANSQILTTDMFVVTSSVNNNSFVTLPTPPYKSRCIVSCQSNIECKVFPSSGTSMILPTGGNVPSGYQLYHGSTIEFQYDATNTSWRVMHGLQNQRDVRWNDPFNAQNDGDVLVWNGSYFRSSSVVGLTTSWPSNQFQLRGDGAFVKFDTSTAGGFNGGLGLPVSTGGAGNNTLITKGTLVGSISAGAIFNSLLTNSSVTIGSTPISLGGSATALAGVTSITGLSSPSLGVDAANKTYVDAQVAAGLNRITVNADAPAVDHGSTTTATVGIGFTRLTAGAGTDCNLPTGVKNDMCYTYNSLGGTITVYPQSGGTITGGAAVGTSCPLTAGGVIGFLCYAPNTWVYATNNT